MDAANAQSTEQTLARHSPAHFERPEAQTYIRGTPGWSYNAYNVGIWFRFTPANLTTPSSAIVRKR